MEIISAGESKSEESPVIVSIRAAINQYLDGEGVSEIFALNDYNEQLQILAERMVKKGVDSRRVWFILDDEFDLQPIPQEEY